jgi:hypothetical protein
MLPSPLVSLACAAVVSFASLRGARAVPEVAAPDLPDTAMAEMTSSGPVIFYNPALYRAAGPAREFVRAHEYGHVLLGHLEDEAMITTRAGRARAEAEADCFAARSVPRAAVIAMAALVRSLPAEPRDAVYGTKPERARRILACGGVDYGQPAGAESAMGLTAQSAMAALSASQVSAMP